MKQCHCTLQEYYTRNNKKSVVSLRTFLILYLKIWFDNFVRLKIMLMETEIKHNFHLMKFRLLGKFQYLPVSFKLFPVLLINFQKCPPRAQCNILSHIDNQYTENQ